MSNLSLVKSENFGSIRCDLYTEGNDFWMTRRQIGEALEYENPNDAIKDIHRRHRDRLDKFSRGVQIALPSGGTQNTTVYSSKGVYEICRWSQQSNADKFYDWVYDLLEGIRTGRISLFDVPQTLPDALRLAADLAEQIEKQAPLVAFAETCSASKDSVLIRELAKIASKSGIVTGERRLYKKLREWGLIFARSTEPYQEYIDRGYFEVTQSTKTTSGNVRLFKVTRVTPKGQIYVLDRLKRECSLITTGTEA